MSGFSMHRFSIRTLMGVVLASAVGLAALRNKNDVWMGLLLLVSLCSGGYLAFAIRNHQRTS
jgi:hypothetical protein